MKGVVKNQRVFAFGIAVLLIGVVGLFAFPSTSMSAIGDATVSHIVPTCQPALDATGSQYAWNCNTTWTVNNVAASCAPLSPAAGCTVAFKAYAYVGAGSCNGDSWCLEVYYGLSTNVAAGQSSQMSQAYTMPLTTLNGQNTFEVVITVRDDAGAQVSRTMTTQFSPVGSSWTLTMLTEGGACPTTPAAGAYPEAIGSEVQLAAPANCLSSLGGSAVFVNWEIMVAAPEGQPGYTTVATPTSLAYSLTMNNNYFVDVVWNQAGIGSYNGPITVTAVPNIEVSVSPAGAQTVSSGGSITFTFTAGAGYTTGPGWGGWKLENLFNGTTSTATFTYAKLHAAMVSAGTASLFVTTAAAVSTPSLVITASQGGTTFPVPGTYPEAWGTPVTVTETPSTGYCFVGWTENLVAAGTGSSITVSFQIGQTAVQTTLGASFQSCTTPPPTTSTTTGGGSGSTNLDYLWYIVILFGIAMALAGLVI
jgi:hypothetical protein